MTSGVWASFHVLFGYLYIFGEVSFKFLLLFFLYQIGFLFVLQEFFILGINHFSNKYDLQMFSPIP